MTCSDAGQLGALRRHQLEREPIIRKCKEMREAMNMGPHVGLTPPLILTTADRISA